MTQEPGNPQNAPAINNTDQTPATSDETILLKRSEIRRYQQQQQELSRQIGSLLVIDGTQADIGRHVDVETTVEIGREPRGLHLHDRRSSRRHATVSRQGERFTVRDLNSTNGTLLNGEQLTDEQPLNAGDTIVIGQTMIKFSVVNQTEAGYLRQVEQLMSTDDLTGLVAKHRFDAALAEAIHVSEAAGRPVSALMMDMDGLKAINDRHGHHVGAHTISCVGVLIGRILEGKGEACRFGGDEFSAFLPRTDLTDALAIAERIRQQVEALHVEHGSAKVNARISIGAAVRPPEVKDVEGLLALADRALYRAKAKGRNVVSD